MKLDLTTSVTIRPTTYWASLDGQTVLFSSEDRRLHALNRTAASVWSAMDNDQIVAEMVERIAPEYGAHRQDIEADVLAVLERFVESELCSVGAYPKSSRPGPTRRGCAGSASQLGRRGAQRLGPYRALGVPVVVETDDALLSAALDRVLDPLRSADVDFLDDDDVARLQLVVVTAVDGNWRISRNGRSIVTVSTRERALRTVVAECNSAPLRHIDDAVVFHAAGADLGRGVVLVPGVSNAGKSTLVTQLLQRGHAYVSDEAIAVDLDSLHARPYAKSICLEAGSHLLFPELAPRGVLGGADSTTWDVDPRMIGPGRISSGGSICALVFARFEAGATAALQPIEPFEVLQMLIANAFDFAHVGQAGFDALVRMADALPAYVLVHGGGTSHLDQLETLFGGRRAISL